jgi:hypothetical protein
VTVAVVDTPQIDILTTLTASPVLVVAVAVVLPRTAEELVAVAVEPHPLVKARVEQVV